MLGEDEAAESTLHRALASGDTNDNRRALGWLNRALDLSDRRGDYDNLPSISRRPSGSARTTEH